MRTLIAVILAAALAGCLSSPHPRDIAAASVMTGDLDGDRLVVGDGAVLPLRHWLTSSPPRAVVLALHGFNDYSNAFAAAATAWMRGGIATYAYDQRGFGAAPGRGQWAGARRLIEDADTTARLLRHRYPGVPLYLLGESMGGAVAVLAATSRGGAAEVDGVILVAPAVWGRETMSLAERIGLWLAGLLPAITLSPELIDLVPVRITPSDNIPMLRAYGADPLVIKETRADALNGLVDLMSAALRAAPRFDAQALILYGARDDIVPRAPVRRFIGALPARAKLHQRIAFYPQGYHMLLRDLEARLPIADIAAWIADRSAPLPSRADDHARARLTGQAGPLAAAVPPAANEKTN
jgi:acylglycerol lipase